MLAIHVSNLYLDLKPVCASLAADAGAAAFFQDDLEISPQEAAEGKCASQWVVIGRRDESSADDPLWQPLVAVPSRAGVDGRLLKRAWRFPVEVTQLVVQAFQPAR